MVNPKIYYKLENFYANHRNFVKSRNYKQLRGNALTAAELGTSCDPVLKMSDLGDKIPKISLNKQTIRSDDVAYPCGLIGKYFFNDTYSLASSDGKRITIDETNIAHSVDRNYKFKKPTINNPDSVMWLDITNEHVMVWY